MIGEYTREAGVRTLERQIGTIARKVAARVATDGADTAIVDAERAGLPRAAAVPIRKAFRTSRPGVATGWRWTETGGDVLFIEAALLPGGNGQVTLTGQLGNVMQESARAALSTCGRTRASSASPRVPQQAGHPHPRAGRRHPQGRAVGRA